MVLSGSGECILCLYCTSTQDNKHYPISPQVYFQHELCVDPSTKDAIQTATINTTASAAKSVTYWAHYNVAQIVVLRGTASETVWSATCMEKQRMFSTSLSFSCTFYYSLKHTCDSNQIPFSFLLACYKNCSMWKSVRLWKTVPCTLNPCKTATAQSTPGSEVRTDKRRKKKHEKFRRMATKQRIGNPNCKHCSCRLEIMGELFYLTPQLQNSKWHIILYI